MVIEIAICVLIGIGSFAAMWLLSQLANLAADAD